MNPSWQALLTHRSTLVTVACAGLMSSMLASMGRRLWCACGTATPWSFDTWSSHNSQHLLDPYTASHVLHGVLFFALLWPLGQRLHIGWRASIATLIEAVWEVAENSPVIIERYRENTVSLDYFGDSIANSLGDLASCLVGFAIAARLPWRVSLGMFILTELVMAWWIRDNLTLNVIMLVHPLESIRAWQMAY